jgi:LCP family protein required for cell wall assembly
MPTSSHPVRRRPRPARMRLPARVYRRRRLAVGLAALLLLGVVGLATGFGYTLLRFGQIASVHIPGLRKPSRPDEGINLLVVGSDTRQGLRDGGFGDAAGQRSDVIILVHLTPKTRQAALLSLPRDLYVPIAGAGGPAKINSAFSRGPGQLVETIHQNFGIPIHHYLLVNFDGFREVVDALGGVSLRFPRPVRDSDNGHNESGLNVPRAGCQRLRGDQALALARSRHFQYQGKDGRWRDDSGADLGRIRRQQTMLQALAGKALGRRLANPIRANAFIGSLAHSLTRDDALSIGQAVTLARQFRSFDLGQLHSATLPTVRAVQRHGKLYRAGEPGFQRALGAGWEQVLLPRQPEAQAAVARLLGWPAAGQPSRVASPPVAVPSSVSVTVKNATPTAGLAARTTAELQRLGFKARNGGNADARGERTTVHYETGQDAAADTVDRVVSVGGPLQRVRWSGLNGAVVLVLGSDFLGLNPQAATRPPAAAKPSSRAPAKPDLPAWDPRPC